MKLQVKTKTGFIELESDKPFLEKLKCRGCGKEIYWAKTKNGKAMPVSMLGNGDMVSHFYDCPKQADFRKPKVIEHEVTKGFEERTTEQHFLNRDKALCVQCKKEFIDKTGNNFVCPDCESDLEGL